MDFKLTTLGTSAAGPVPGRWPSGQYLKTAKSGFLFDAGEGIQIAMQRHNIGWGGVDAILISHLHGDHIYGLPGLLTSWGLNQRTKPLQIIGPANIEPFLQAVFEYSYTGLPFPVEYKVVDTTQAGLLVFEDQHVQVHTIPLKHRIPTVGYLVREKERPRTMLGDKIKEYQIPFQQIPAIKAGADYQGPDGLHVPNSELTANPPAARSFAYCSDTAPLPELLSHIKGVDLLLHEATFLHDLKEQAALSGHSTARQAATIAREAAVGQLILTHFSPRYGNLQVFLDEAQPIFPNTTLAKEGQVFEVAYGNRQA